jgi:hypothetical protein
MRILELKALQGWSLARTAEIFQVTSRLYSSPQVSQTSLGRSSFEGHV